MYTSNDSRASGGLLNYLKGPLCALTRKIPGFCWCLPDFCLRHLLARTAPVDGTALLMLPPNSRSPEEMDLLASVHEGTASTLASILDQRTEDKAFVDQRMTAYSKLPDPVREQLRCHDIVLGKSNALGHAIIGPVGAGSSKPVPAPLNLRMCNALAQATAALSPSTPPLHGVTGLSLSELATGYGSKAPALVFSDKLRRQCIEDLLQDLVLWLRDQHSIAAGERVLQRIEHRRWLLWHHARSLKARRVNLLAGHIVTIFQVQRDIKNDVLPDIRAAWGTGDHYPLAVDLLVQLTTADQPPQHALHTLMPYSIEGFLPLLGTEGQNAANKWAKRFSYFFKRCGCRRFAEEMAGLVVMQMEKAHAIIDTFTFEEIISAASFHGNIGQGKRTLDKMAASEQSKVLGSDDSTRQSLLKGGAEYLTKFGMKFLVAANGRTGPELLSILRDRLSNSKDEELANARTAVWEITRQRLLKEPLDTVAQQVDELRSRHGVCGVSLCLAAPHSQRLQTICSGQSRVAGGAVTPTTLFEIASLSKTVAVMFSLEYFRKRDIGIDTPVNALLARIGSAFRITGTKPKTPKEATWPDKVTIRHLCNHNGLNMHYVNGVPIEDGDMPNTLEFLNGNDKYQYPPVQTISEPGTAFHYSGAGFLVLQHIIETMEGIKDSKGISRVLAPFLEALGVTASELTFDPKPKGVDIADGHTDKGTRVGAGRKMFPAFPAGALGTPTGLMKVLQQLTRAFHDTRGCGPISHDTASQMLWGSDRGCRDFMGVQIGLGVFVAESGRNRIAIHQGANDGYRSLYFHCFKGPDQGAGFCVVANGDNRAMMAIAEIAQCLLQHGYPGFEGVDPNKFMKSVSVDSVKQEEIVNFGYKNMVFCALASDLPDIVGDRGPLSPDSVCIEHNVMVGATLLSCTEQSFAQVDVYAHT